MNDTSPWAEARLAELWRQRSGSERVVAACRMFETARTLLAAGIRSREPGISEVDLRLRVFELTYASDFEPQQWQALRARVAATQQKK